MELIKAGRYKGRPIDWAYGKTGNGNLVINVCFNVEVAPDELPRQCYWSGFFTEKTMENTLKQLSYCGLQGDDFAKLALGAKGGYLDVNAEVELTIGHEQTNEGKTFARVQWVNKIGGANFRNALTEQEAVIMTQGLNLRGEFAAVAQKYGLKVGERKAAPAPAPAPAATVNEDDIPF